MNMRRFSRETQRNYLRDIGRLATFLGRSPDTATADDLRRFQIEQQEDGVPVPTMNSIVSALRFFFTHTLDRPDLARRLVRLAHPRNLPVVLSRDEVARLLNATTCLKHQAALSVAYGAGLRVAEVSMLKVADVDSERMLLRVERGKGGRYRNAMLSEDLLTLLREWWKVGRQQGVMHRDGWLFPGQHAMKPISTRPLARLRALRSDLIDPTIAVHHGRVVKRTGDGSLVEFSSVVDAVRCAIEVQNAMVERNAGVPDDRRIEFRIGIHLGDVVEESDGDLMGDGVNIAARLEGICEPGSICLSEQAYWQVKARLDVAIDDRGGGAAQEHRRSGPRLFAAGRRSRQAKPQRPRSPRRREAFAATRAARQAFDRRAAVPNMSGDPEQEYFADGMVEDIITGLSRIKWLFVIARNSSFVYKGKAVDVQQVGRELGVRYVLEGGVRKAGNRLRITAQLLEAETGAHLWADSYDGALEDVFDLQDQITDKVVGIVEPSLSESEIERSRRKRPENLDAYDLYLRALPYLSPNGHAQDAPIAAGLLQEALRLDPDYAAAHAYIRAAHRIASPTAGSTRPKKSPRCVTRARQPHTTWTTRQPSPSARW